MKNFLFDSVDNTEIKIDTVGTTKIVRIKDTDITDEDVHLVMSPEVFDKFVRIAMADKVQ